MVMGEQGCMALALGGRGCPSMMTAGLLGCWAAVGRYLVPHVSTAFCFLFSFHLQPGSRATTARPPPPPMAPNAPGVRSPPTTAESSPCCVPRCSPLPLKTSRQHTPSVLCGHRGDTVPNATLGCCWMQSLRQGPSAYRDTRPAETALMATVDNLTFIVVVDVAVVLQPTVSIDG